MKTLHKGLDFSQEMDRSLYMAGGVEGDNPGAREAADLGRIFFSGQERALGLPSGSIDPKRVNGTRMGIPPKPLDGYYAPLFPGGQFKWWERDRDARHYDETIGEALSTVEKHDLAGTNFG